MDKAEVVEHWKSKFGQISANHFFEQVGADSNGVIELSEFKAFWAAVSKKNSDKDILEELENIKNGETSLKGLLNVLCS